MKRYSKMQLIMTSVVVLVPIIIGLFLWNELPDRMVTHWNGNGEPDGWSSKGFAVFGLPLVLLAVHWLTVFFTTHDPRNKYQSSKVFGIILWLMPVTSLIFGSATYVVALGREVNVNMIACAFLGILLILIGNYLPKCKQNYTIGIKVMWALDDEENWNKTHRLAGKLWVIGGVVILVTAFVSIEYFFCVLIAASLIMVSVPILYSYLYYKKNDSGKGENQ